MAASPQSSRTVVLPHDEIVLAVVGEKLLDDRACKALHDAVLPAAEARRRPVVLDMSHVRYLPSLAIGALTSLRNELMRSGRTMTMIHVQPPVRQVLAVTRMDRVFELSDTLETALTKLHASAGRA
jgi:anti-anti-sigma factor